MDLEDFMWIKICDNTENAIVKLTSNFMSSTEKNKNFFLQVLLDIYIKHFLDVNLWLLKKICKVMTEKKKNASNIKAKVLDIIHIFAIIKSERKEASFGIPILTKEKRNYITTKLSIECMGDNNEYDSQLKTVLNGNIYNLVSFVKNEAIDHKMIFHIISYLLTLKKKQIFFKDGANTPCNDITDILFNVALFPSPSHHNTLEKEVQEFIGLCYDLFQLNKKNIKLLYIAYFVKVKKKIASEAYQRVSKSDFLFTYHMVDTIENHEMEPLEHENIDEQGKLMEVSDVKCENENNPIFHIIKR